MAADTTELDPAAPALGALADGTRRAILALLREGELSVGELAGQLPVTRPAVSQHLKVLKEAGLVGERVEGTRHLCRLEPLGLESLRSFVEELWDISLDRYAAAAQPAQDQGGDMPLTDIAPVVKTIVVPLSPERAFDLFFEGMGSWWPLRTHSVFEDGAANVAVDPREGGHIVERAKDGREADWGEFTVWDRPRRAAFTWHPGYEDASATEVEVRFSPEGGLTRVDLEHRGWAALGDRAETTRAGYETGWNSVFAVSFGSAAHARRAASPRGRA
jgi:DNA-binding transcriptional ArsR family regulator